MFESVKPIQSQEPEDMFAESDAAPSAPPAPSVPAPRPVTAAPISAVAPAAAPNSMAAPSMQVPPAPATAAHVLSMDDAAQIPQPKKGFPWKGIFVIFIIAGVIGGAAYLAHLLLSAPAPLVPEAPSDQTPSLTAPVVPEVTIPAPTAPVSPPAAVVEADQDKDGLTDIEEAQLGTSPIQADTDADGLFDAEEVNTYHTNPLNADTDGDTFLDGQEVQNGYNPNGPGTLTAIPQS